MIIAADVGATKAIVASYTCEGGPRRPALRKTYLTGSFGGPAELLHDFTALTEGKTAGAVLGIAGPVRKGEASMINLPWAFNERDLGGEMGFPVRLLNDLHATANAVPHLEADDVIILHEGNAAAGGNIAVIAPGTGLGEAFLTWEDGRYRPHASEGGHADFAPRNLLEAELFGYLHARREHVSYERVCSGPGILNVYNFLKERGYGKEPPWLSEELRAADDPARVIASAAVDPQKDCELCVSALRIFVAVLGAEAGNLALKVNATAGIYIAGGIPPRILPCLKDREFLESVQNKGRERFLVEAMPVKLIMNPEAALLGAAIKAFEIFGRGDG